MIQSAVRGKLTVLGLGELHASDDPDDVLACIGLGSCVALCAYDPYARIGGMVHLVLPNSVEGRTNGSDAKFVNLGIPLLLQRMETLGAIRRRTAVKLVGGAHMIVVPGFEKMPNIGDRNVEAARIMIASLGLKLCGGDIGGNRGRTVRLFVASGQLTVSTAGGPSVEI